MPLRTDDLDDIPDQGLISLIIDLYRQKRDAREAINALHEDIRDVLFYIYTERPNIAMAEIARKVGVSRNTIQGLLSKHKQFIRMKSKGANKQAKGANLPDHQYVADVNLELVPVSEAIQQQGQAS